MITSSTRSLTSAELPSGFVLGVHRPQPLQHGTSFVLEYRALPGMPVGVWLDDRVQVSGWPELEQALLLPPASAFPVGVLVADATGLATGTWWVPGGLALVDSAAWFQGFAGLSLPLQASALAGGLIR